LIGEVVLRHRARWDPLDDITNTRKISQVILRGAAVDRSKMPN
jgi:hypothetical protein